MAPTHDASKAGASGPSISPATGRQEQSVGRAPVFGQGHELDVLGPRQKGPAVACHPCRRGWRSAWWRPRRGRRRGRRAGRGRARSRGRPRSAARLPSPAGAPSGPRRRRSRPARTPVSRRSKVTWPTARRRGIAPVYGPWRERGGVERRARSRLDSTDLGPSFLEELELRLVGLGHRHRVTTAEAGRAVAGARFVPHRAQQALVGKVGQAVRTDVTHGSPRRSA